MPVPRTSSMQRVAKRCADQPRYNCSGFTFIRIGTSGGIGVPPGTVVVTTEALDGQLRPVGVACVATSRVHGWLVRHSNTIWSFWAMWWRDQPHLTVRSAKACWQWLATCQRCSARRCAATTFTRVKAGATVRSATTPMPTNWHFCNAATTLVRRVVVVRPRFGGLITRCRCAQH